jgi:hypothetical protein
VGGVDFRLERLDLYLERLVLFHLAAEESTGQGHFFCNAHGREQIHVLELVLAAGEVLHLHQALVDEGVEAVAQPAHAHAQLLSQLALGQVWVFLQDAHDPKNRRLLGSWLDCLSLG